MSIVLFGDCPQLLAASGVSGKSVHNLTGVELDALVEAGPSIVSNVVVTTPWQGRSLSRLVGAAVVFDRCSFEQGVNFTETVTSSRIVFQDCTFGGSVNPEGRDSAIQNSTFGKSLVFRRCEFYRDVILNRTSFDDILIFDSCIFHGRVRAERISAWSALEFSQCSFCDSVELGGEAHGLVSFSGCEIGHSLQLQKANLLGGLDLSSSQVQAMNERVTQPFVGLDQVLVPSNIALDGLTFEPGARGQLRIRATSFDMMRGLPWSTIRRVLQGGTVADEQVVMAQLRKSYERQGATEDASQVYRALKSSLAYQQGLVGRLIHWFMMGSSGWGTKPSLLLFWSLSLTTGFGILYFWRLQFYCLIRSKYDPRSGVLRRASRMTLRFLDCLVVSFRITLLQYDQADISDLGSRSPSATRAERGCVGVEDLLRGMVGIHRILASLFLLMLGAYVGSLLSGG